MGAPQMPPHMNQGGPMPTQMMGPPPSQGPHPGPPPQQIVGPMATPPTPPMNQGADSHNQHVVEAALISFD